MIMIEEIPLWVYPVLAWMIFWKALGCWRAARKGHVIWFVSFFVFNTFGLLPILYLLFFQNVKVSRKVKRKIRKKKFPTLD